jgi:hypothetical protein
MIFIFIIIFLFVNYCKEKLHEFQNIKKSISLRSRDFSGPSRGFCLCKGLLRGSVRLPTAGHGVYELAYDAGQKAVYAASAPLSIKIKPPGNFQLAADSLKIEHADRHPAPPFCRLTG